MKKLIFLAVCALLSINVFAQKAKSKDNKSPESTLAPAPTVSATSAIESILDRTGKSKPVDWPQLETFQKVLAEKYRLAEKGDFNPIRTQSKTLVQAVQEIMHNPFPEPYQTSDMKVLMGKLEERVDMTNKLVLEGVEDQELMRVFMDVHDIFHKIASIRQSNSN